MVTDAMVTDAMVTDAMVTDRETRRVGLFLVPTAA